MARSSIDRDSKEYIKVPVTAPAGIDLGAQAVSIAVVDVAARPLSSDYKTATWDGTSAKTLVGPGVLPLAPGNYKVWVKVTDNPEVPVLAAGTITVT